MRMTTSFTSHSHLSLSSPSESRKSRVFDADGLDMKRSASVRRGSAKSTGRGKNLLLYVSPARFLTPVVGEIDVDGSPSGRIDFQAAEEDLAVSAHGRTGSTQAEFDPNRVCTLAGSHRA